MHERLEAVDGDAVLEAYSSNFDGTVPLSRGEPGGLEVEDDARTSVIWGQHAETLPSVGWDTLSYFGAWVIQTGECAGQRDVRVGRGTRDELNVLGPLCADLDGCSFHAAVPCYADIGPSTFCIALASSGSSMTKAQLAAIGPDHRL